ncbi:MAG: hypothetical protein AAGJ35_06985, partial [Myxococcota bacterium]
MVRKRFRILVMGGVLLLVFGVYVRTLSYSFLTWDDPAYVLKRKVLYQIARGEGGWLSLLSPSDAMKGRTWEFFPIRDLSYAWDAWRGGRLDAVYFRWSQIVILLLLVCGAMALAWQLGVGLWGQALTGLLLGLHPLVVEPAAWISGRKDLLMVLFGVSALLCLEQAVSHSRALSKDPVQPRLKWGWIALAGLSFLGSCGSKGPGVVVLGLVMFWSWQRHGRKVFWALRGFWASLFVVSVLWLGLVSWIGHSNRILDVGAGQDLWEWFQRSTDALGMILWVPLRWLIPEGLSPSYHQRFVLRVGGISVWSWLVLLLLLWGGLAWRKGVFLQTRSTRLWLFWGIGLLALVIVPYAGLIRVAQQHADRFWLGACVLFAVGLGFASQHVRWLGLAAWCLLPWFAWQTHHYLPAWKSTGHLWRHVYLTQPTHPDALINLSAMAISAKQYDV